MKDHLIVTVDYEVFGNGRGCLDACVVEPAEQLLELAQRLSLPLTLFVEATELAAMDRAGIGAVSRVKDQLRRAADTGHDIALHVHPQWWRAPYNGRWEVHPERRIADLPPARVAALLEEGIGWISDCVPGWSCTAFCAGALSIQPSETVAAALLELGIAVDSSVAPGRFVAGQSWFDFRDVPEACWWRTDGDVCREGTGPLIEVPIATGGISARRDLAAIVRSRGRRNPPGCRRGPRRPPVVEMVSRVAGLGRVMLDFCRHDGARLEEIMKSWLHRGQGGSPVVAIGHTKNTTSGALSHLADFVERARHSGVETSTYGDWLG